MQYQKHSVFINFSQFYSQAGVILEYFYCLDHVYQPLKKQASPLKTDPG